MFILRKITGNGGELNFALGDSYSLILKDSQPKQFKEVLSVNGHDAFEEDLYGFIGYGVSQFHMLFKNHVNYIMTETGKTFTNVTHHDKIRARNAESAESENHFEEVQRAHEDIEHSPGNVKCTHLFEHFSKYICQTLQRTLNVNTVEEANQLTDEELLKAPGFGKIYLQKLRRLRNNA